MPLFDMPLSQLQTYRPERDEPADFDAFWTATLSEAGRQDLGLRLEPNPTTLRTVEAYNLTFAGYAEQPIKGWFLLPRQRSGPLPCVVQFLGYGGGRGLPSDSLIWSSSGFAHLIMDSRGQGSSWQRGDTPDVETDPGNPQLPGFMTKGILKPETYYYRRIMTDAVRAVEAAASHPEVDAQRIAVAGNSQGGGLALAAGGLSRRVAAVIADVPFLCMFRRATEIIDTQPYNEISRFLQVHRDKMGQVFRTLSYFDGVNMAARAVAPALFSVGLMDMICPPSTVYAAYNHYAGPKQIEVYRYNQHEGGGSHHDQIKVQWLQELFGV